MTHECTDSDGLQRKTVRQLVAEAARLSNRSVAQTMWQTIAMTLVCTLLGVGIAVGLPLLGHIL